MKKISKEPYAQIEESENINKNFYNKGIMSSLFHTHLNKIFEKESNRNFNFGKIYSVPEEYTYKNLSKNLDSTSTKKIWKSFKEGDTTYSDVLFSFLGFEYTKGIIIDTITNMFLIPVPFLVKKLIKSLSHSDPDENPLSRYFFCFLLITCNSAVILLGYWSVHYMYYGAVMAKGFSQVKILIEFYRHMLSKKCSISLRDPRNISPQGKSQVIFLQTARV